ncbi:ran-binding protein 3 [Sitodiplosis mosellana]|uniref:ran-binding protein 3 n=1 Tax=Sitodiplosis mosellana TaxID=263140 RepID=UPI0024442B4C|nr:ran-binding protein 3 [Sitodiplosis mosellana]
MLRPSAFQNNGNSETASSSKSILRPSSFQLAPSNLAAANNSNNKSECSDEPSTTSHSDSPFELKEEKQSTSSSTSNEAEAAEAAATTKEDDSKISSTTSNDGENNGENSDESKVIPNPFNNVKNAEIGDDDTDATSKPAADDKTKSQTADKKSDFSGGNNLFASNTNNTKNLFAAAASHSPFLAANNSSKENNFVFGQNIHERIVGVPDTSVSSVSSADDNQSDSSSGSKLFAVSSASTSEAAAAGSSTNGAEPKESSTVEDLTKVAREYEESRAQKRKLDAVETFTGEEDEINVVDMSCKLFAFIASNWEQRGPGGLRLNDVKASAEDARSRVVFRTLGNFRVLLNTKVWGGMVVEKPSQKSLRLTAIDSNDGSVKIFLVMARPDDISTLYKELKKRIETERKREKTEESTSSESNTSKGSHHGATIAGAEEPDTKKDRKT